MLERRPVATSVESRALSEFLRGAAAPARGALYLAQHRSLWIYSAPLLAVGAAVAVLTAMDLLLIPEGPASLWSRFAITALEWAVASSVFVLQIGIAFLAPLLDWLSEQTEEERGSLPRGPGFLDELTSLRFWKNAFRALLEGIKLLGFKIGLWIGALLLGWIPWIGPVAAYLLGGVATGVDFLDYPLARRHWTLSQKLHWLRARAFLGLGFSLAVFLGLAIPGLGPLLIVPSVIGGTLLVVDHLEITEAATESGSAE